MGAQHASAQHWGECQRHKTRDHDRDRKGDRKFAEDAADDAAHQQYRDKDRDQGDRDRNDREADFARALQRRLEGPHPALYVTHNVFQHHDGVIDHESDRQGQRQQRHVVDGKSERIHGGTGADQRHWHRERRDNRRGHGPQEHEDDEDDETNSDQQGFLHVEHRLPDSDGTIEQRLHLDRGRHLRAEIRQPRAHRIDDLDGVGVGLALNRDHDGAGAVEPGRNLVVFDPVDYPRNFVELDRLAVAIRHDHIAIGARLLHGARRNECDVLIWP
jgi:hypothetical protein